MKIFFNFLTSNCKPQKTSSARKKRSWIIYRKMIEKQPIWKAFFCDQICPIACQPKVHPSPLPWEKSFRPQSSDASYRTPNSTRSSMYFLNYPSCWIPTRDMPSSLFDLRWQNLHANTRGFFWLDYADMKLNLCKRWKLLLNSHSFDLKLQTTTHSRICDNSQLSSRFVAKG